MREDFKSTALPIPNSVRSQNLFQALGQVSLVPKKAHKFLVRLFYGSGQEAHDATPDFWKSKLKSSRDLFEELSGVCKERFK